MSMECGNDSRSKCKGQDPFAHRSSLTPHGVMLWYGREWSAPVTGGMAECATAGCPLQVTYESLLYPETSNYTRSLGTM